jgi:hypothetical protein
MAAVTSASPGMDRRHQNECTDKSHDGDEKVLWPVVGHLADLLEVAGDPRDEAPGALLVVPAPRRASGGGRRPCARMSVSMLMPSLWPQKVTTAISPALTT